MKRLSPRERRALGKAARKRVPRSSHAEYVPAADRQDPIDILSQQAATRVPELVPIRHGRMASSPSSFYRGTAAIMADDLQHTPDTGLRVQACGDAHLSNFGIFASPERRLVFDVNDFDETLPGPWEWDVKRLAASLVIAGRTNGLTALEQAKVVTSAVARYREAMASFAGMGQLDVWYQRLEVDTVIQEIRASGGRSVVEFAESAREKAVRNDSLRAFNKLTTVVKGKVRFQSKPPLLVPLEELVPPGKLAKVEDRFRTDIANYGRTLLSDREHLLKQFEVEHIARKVVGVGSVGTLTYVVLMFSRDYLDPFLLQIKEARRSVLERYFGKSEFNNAGRRVVTGQRLMQATPDTFLGWQQLHSEVDEQRHFYFRQLRDGKASIDVDHLSGPAMEVYGRTCAWTLARAHARSGDRIAISAYLGSSAKFDDAIRQFAIAYADQAERDYAALLEAIAAGRIQAITGL